MRIVFNEVSIKGVRRWTDHHGFNAGEKQMTRTDYLNEISRFKHVLSALDAQHRLNGHQYTPSEIQNVRRSLMVLEQLVHVGLYDAKGQ